TFQGVSPAGSGAADDGPDHFGSGDGAWSRCGHTPPLEAGISDGAGRATSRYQGFATPKNVGGTAAVAQGEPETQASPGNPKKSHGHTVGSAAGRYALIQRMSQHYHLRDVCHALQVPRSSYYAWRGREPGRRAQDNQRLREQLSHLFVSQRQVYGSRRLTVCLQRLGFPCSRNRVARHLRALQLKARQKRAFRPKTTDPNHPHPIAPNRLAQQRRPQTINRVWV